MRRADRLFRIVQMLRSGRLKTARALAERLQVSDRTIYRDVRDLQLAGQPIEGEAGVGYVLRRDFDLPPLMFTPDEVTALVLGARLVKAWGGTEMVAAAGAALARIATWCDSSEGTLLPGASATLRKRRAWVLLASAPVGSRRPAGCRRPATAATSRVCKTEPSPTTSTFSTAISALEKFVIPNS